MSSERERVTTLSQERSISQAPERSHTIPAMVQYAPLPLFLHPVFASVLGLTHRLYTSSLFRADKRLNVPTVSAFARRLVMSSRGQGFRSGSGHSCARIFFSVTIRGVRDSDHSAQCRSARGSMPRPVRRPVQGSWLGYGAFTN